MWGPTAKSFVNFLAQWCHLIGTAEHHLAKSEVGKLNNTFKQLGFETDVAPAVATGRSESGTSGGTSLSAVKYLQRRRLAKSLDHPAHQFVPLGVGHD